MTNNHYKYGHKEHDDKVEDNVDNTRVAENQVEEKENDVQEEKKQVCYFI